uniref:Uncharacterized protein n=1 Tax=Cacopsylla melanoneura TaxID=428564 RepID=A0A8D8X966_9HEMI
MIRASIPLFRENKIIDKIGLFCFLRTRLISPFRNSSKSPTQCDGDQCNAGFNNTIPGLCEKYSSHLHTMPLHYITPRDTSNVTENMSGFRPTRIETHRSQIGQGTPVSS